MVNFDIIIRHVNGETAIVAYATFFADAIQLASGEWCSVDVVDHNTGEVLRSYVNGVVTYLV